MPGSNLTHEEAKARKKIVLSSVEYRVELDVARGSEFFHSTTEIDFGAQVDSSTFLDFIGHEVESIELNGEKLDPQEVFVDNRIELKDLKERNHVKVEALGVYSHTGEGLHRSVDPSDGNVYLYTQFEVPDARRVYAVFDQPDIKATFNFSVIVPSSWIVLGNMPEVSSEDIEGQTAAGTLENGAMESLKRWTFAQTPVMSSYLTAICAGPYAQWNTTYHNEDGRIVPLGMYCRQALKDAFAKDVDYLFDITKKGFAFYAKTWSIPYPYAKYDQVYVPEYNAGAMENIGLVTLRDQYIFESKVTDAMAERRVVTVLHELAHMWFGDYVTMKWWNDLWLNESFAEFTSNLATAEASDWTEAWTTFNSGEKSWALNQDQLSTTHPIVADIKDLQDTYVNFDGITYAKGAAVLKQLVAYVGRKEFFEGIQHYLEKHAYSNATLNDLLAELEETSGRDLKNWSSLWLEKSNINTLSADVKVTENSAGEKVIDSYTLKQTAPKDAYVIRPHRLAVGFYNRRDDGKIVRDEQYVFDFDGESQDIEQLKGLKKPDCIVINDDDLTYAKLRFDRDSLEFAANNLHDFEDSLARSIVWLSLWDMTRDGEFPAERFIETTLRLLAREDQSTTFRYAVSYLLYTMNMFVADEHRASVKKHVAHELWNLTQSVEPASDAQFQLLTAYLSSGELGDDEFIGRVQSILDDSVKLEGLEVDNNMKWKLIRALATVNAIDEQTIEKYLAERDTTENREFALGARAALAKPEAKDWAWNESLHNESLTNMQLEEVALGISSARQELADVFINKYFETADWIWEHRSFHMAEALLMGLYPRYANPQNLSDKGHAWLESHADADRALRRIVIEELESTDRVLRVHNYNNSL